jgi:hypothetical protein
MEEDNGVFRFVEKDPSGVPIGEKRLRVSLRETPSNHKVRLRLEVPVVQTETVEGIDNPKIVRVGTADLVLTFAKTSSTAERNLVAGLMADLLQTTQTELDAIITGLENLY